MAKKDILKNWQTLQVGIKKIDEKEASRLLEIERKGARRTQFMLRLHGRMNVLRAQRERQQLIGA